MPAATYELAVNWSNDGSTWVDETSRCIGIEWAHGRGYASQLTGRSVPAQLVATLLNPDGRFNSFNTAGALYGNLLPGRQVRLTMTSNATTTTMFLGRLDMVEPQPGLGRLSRAILRAVGPLAFIASRPVNVPMSTGVRTDTAVGTILDEIGWSTALRTLDTGLTTMARWWTGGLDHPGEGDALHALREIEDTENGFLREGKDGSIVFENRQHRNAGAHLLSQATFSDSAGAPLGYEAIVQHDPLKEIYNRVEALVRRYASGTLAVLWTNPEAGTTNLVLAPGESKTYWARFPNLDSSQDAVAVDAWTDPASNTDYTANTSWGGGSAAGTSHLTVTVDKFDQAMKMTFANPATAPALYLTLMQARGVPITEQDNIRLVAESTGSQAKYGERTWPLPGKWIPNSLEALDSVNFVLGVYQDPIPVLSITKKANESSGWLDEARARDVSDRVTLKADGTALSQTYLGINEDFYIERIAHKVTRERVHTVTFDLSPADAYGRVIVLDTGPALDTGVLGY